MRPLLPVVVCVAVLGGCSPSSVPATSTTTTTEATTTTTTVPTPAEAAAAFAFCMRSEGIDLPDIPLDTQGLPDLSAVVDLMDTSSAAVRTAVATCAPILTSAQAINLLSDPELLAVVIEQLHRFSGCMRDGGVEGFPDPRPEFSGTGSAYPESVPVDDPLFEQALAACQELIGSVSP
jgi:hypothetical protein